MTSELQQLAKTRVQNSSLIAMHGEVEKAAIGMQGATIYALLDIANALRQQGPDEKTRRKLSLASLIADALAGGRDDEARKLAEDFSLIEQGMDYDQHLGFGR